jgi:hypothetical protein
MSRVHPDATVIETAPIVGHRFWVFADLFPCVCYIRLFDFRDLEARLEGEGVGNAEVEDGRGAALLMSDGSSEVVAVENCFVCAASLVSVFRSATASSRVMAYFHPFGM